MKNETRVAESEKPKIYEFKNITDKDLPIKWAGQEDVLKPGESIECGEGQAVALAKRAAFSILSSELAEEEKKERESNNGQPVHIRFVTNRQVEEKMAEFLTEVEQTSIFKKKGIVEEPKKSKKDEPEE